jgi:competence protein ComEC
MKMLAAGVRFLLHATWWRPTIGRMTPRPSAPRSADRPDSAFASIWHAPLVPAALAATAGIIVDRAFIVPPFAWIAVLGVGSVLWIAARHTSPATGLAFLWLAIAAIGGMHHHQYRYVFAADDIGRLASDDPRLVRLRGRLSEEPTSAGPPMANALRSMPRSEPARSVLEVTYLQLADDWRPVSGRVRLIAAGPLDGLHCGDYVEAIGWLTAPGEPANPGEFDPAAHYLDERITALLSVHKTSEGVVRLAEGWADSPAGWLAAVRGWGRRTLESTLPLQQSGVAAALLLGDGAAMAQSEWDKYIRTGVIHALAISGQHLIILATFLWLALRIAGLPRKRGAWVVAIVLFGYAALTGLRPPATRAAVMVVVLCGAIILRKVVLPANAFALAWLTVLAVRPTDIADAGCQFSFLCVAVLTWGVGHWFRPRSVDPLEELIEESRPLWLRSLRRVGRWIAVAYSVNFVLGMTVLPLVAYRYHVIAPVAFLLGPPVIFIAAIALIAGFLLLIVAAIAPILTGPFAWATDGCLRIVSGLVEFADKLPYGHIAVGDVPGWWLAVFYTGLVLALLLPSVRVWWRPLTYAGIAWTLLGLTAVFWRTPPDGLRVTFLAVGHGGCTVLEAKDGRVVLYDAGAIAGPDVTRRQIAPFLWQRKIRRIDEVLISHADLDHFNGLPSLLDYFPVRLVTLTPTFADKTTPGVRETLAALERSGIQTRIVKAGDRLTAGDVSIDVLHPPAVGPDGNENARSMVLSVNHAGHSLLLTGDLEGPGLERVLAMPPQSFDVLMAPHHGGKSGNPPSFAAWSRPRVVVGCQGPPPWPTQVPAMYEARGATYLGTWPHGAITIMSHRTGLIADTFRTHLQFVVRTGGAK